MMDRSGTTYTLLLALTFLWCAGIVAAPLLRASESAGSPSLYALFGGVCHQFPDRSFHLIGEPLAVCMRCTAIYAGFLAGLILYPLLARRFSLPPHPWLLAVALAPMALDAGLNAAGILSSSMWSRIVTGGMAGLVLPWYLVPVLHEALHQLFQRKRGTVHAGKTQ